MNRTLLSSALLAALAAGCTPKVDKTSPPDVVVAQFDVSATPAVVPSPNDLALDAKTGLLAVPLGASASDADREFARYLGTLDGFPASTSASASFDGALDPATVNASNVLVEDVTDLSAPTAVTGLTPTFVASDDGGKIVVAPPAGGWTPGHAYAVLLLGTVDASHGLKGAQGEIVAGSSLWALVRAKESLVTCPKAASGAQDLTSPDCVAATAVIPTEEKEAVDRLRDQTEKALQLEPLRLLYKPLLDALEDPPASACLAGAGCGLTRSMVALAWTFRITGQPALVFAPSAAPPRVPTPTDLAIDPATGLVAAPIDPTASAAEQEFTRDYLNTLDGFPPQTPGKAGVANKDLDPASLTSSTVFAVDLDDAGTPPQVGLAYDAALRTLIVVPPASGWTKGHRYAIAVRGGAQGVRGAGGETVVASDVWALARAEATLVTCANLGASDCQSALSLAPLTAAQAVQLETLRRSYKPVLDLFRALHGLERLEIAVAWTFQVQGQSELLFNPDLDPALAVIPFPNSLLLDPATGKVALPIPSDPEAAALYTALNTLDGFSTTAPILSENSLARGALDQGELDPATVTPATVGLANLDSTGPAPECAPCVDCAISGTPGQVPQTLQIVPTVPLAERTLYGAYVTTGVHSANGKKVAPSIPWALARMENPLVDADGKSTVSVLSDDQALALEALRLGHKPYLDALVAMGLPRREIALAWTFKTQTTASALPLIKAVPTALGAAGVLPDAPDFLADVTAETVLRMDAAGAPHDRIAAIFAGELPTANLLTGPGGTLNPTAPELEHIPFLVALPDAEAPAAGYPVVVFAHGITRNRTDLLAIANTLATAGFASIATEIAWHGERSSCSGSGLLSGGACTAGTALCDGLTSCDQRGTAGSALCDEASGKCVAADAALRLACGPAATGGLPGDVYCLSQGLGHCLADQKCQAADFARDAAGGVVISGWNYLDVSNLFATRDNFRQQVSDLAQLGRILAGTGSGTCLNDLLLDAGAAAGLDGASYHFLGVSLGAITGLPYVAAAPEVERALFNVPGGDLVTLLQTSPELAALRSAWLAGLAAKGLTPGTPAFDQYLATARWILDPADPLNSAPQVLNAAGVGAGRRALVQYVSGDAFIPNATTESLLASANRASATSKLWWYEFDGSAVAEDDRHGFLLNGKSALTASGQLQAATFLATGNKPNGAQP